MGLFDHLFKTKTPTGGEKMEEHAAEENAAKPTEGGARTPTPQKADHSAFLHPKDFVPRGAPGLTPAPRPVAPGIAGKAAEKRPAIGSPPASDEIVLTLGDVLSRIPAPYLKPGTHDAKRELRFKINDLSSDIARGRAAVPLSRIAHLVPDIFTRQISRDEDMEVRLPLQKLVEQIGLLRSRPKASLLEKIESPIAAIDLPPAAKPVLEVDVKKEPVANPVTGSLSAAHRSVLEPVPSPASPPSPPPSIVLSEPVVASQMVELKPSLESAAAASPVILGSPSMPAASSVPGPSAEAIPPLAEEVFVMPVSPPVEAPVAAPASPVSESQPTIEPPKPVLPPEPIRSVSSPRGAPPPTKTTPPQAQKIVIDWGTVSSSKVEQSTTAGATDLNQVMAGTLHAETDVEGTKLTASESTDIDPSEETIHLSLAAILRQCPREILVGGMPQVDDSVRITLPFAPIDRQLVKGRVEMSALRFILALPEVYQKHFVAKVGVKVPIPLEEVFQNLPAPTQELIPQPPVPPPVVLAPVAPAVAAAPVAPVPAPEAEPVAQELASRQVDPKPTGEPVTPAPAAIEEKITESAGTALGHATLSPLPVIVPAEPPKEQPPVLPPSSEEVPPPAAAPVEDTGRAAADTSVIPSTELPIPAVLPIIGTPEASTAEKAAQPPLPTAVEMAASTAAPEPVPSIASAEVVQGGTAESVSLKSAIAAESAPATVPTARSIETPAVPAPMALEVPPLTLSPAPQETPPAAPVIDPVVSSTFVASAEVNAPPSADAPKLKLQPPFFRPQFAPPPIFGFTPPPAVPESEPPTKPEPPSLLAGLTEASSVAPAVATIAEPTVLKEEPATLVAPAKPADGKPALASEAASEAEPSAEMIALAGEHDAPDIAHFSGEPAPFADLTETLAHETTYVTDLAQVVHVDLPTPEPVEGTTAAAAEAPAEQQAAEAKPTETAKPEEADEHHPVPIVEGLAAAAVAATITDHVPLDFREALTTANEVKASEEAAVSPETLGGEAKAKAEETTPAGALTPVVENVEQAAEAPVPNVTIPVETSGAQTPTVLSPEPPAASVTAAPPPHPLFPLPKVSAEPAHVDVLPPPSLPLRRFDQDAIQALFMTEETLDLPKISRLAAALPGVYACVIATRDQACTGGSLPEGFDLAALLGLAPRVGEAAGRMPIGQLKHFTLYGEAYSVSFFERNGLSLCAVHRPRSFVPGVREKLVALADELSR